MVCYPVPPRLIDLNSFHLRRAGTVESRIRQLVMKLEYVDSLTLAHPFIKGFEQTSYCISEDEVRAVAQGDISEIVAQRKMEDIEGKEDASIVYSTTFYIGLAIEPKNRASPSRGLFDLSLMIFLSSWFRWPPPFRHIVSHDRFYQAG
jgi:poly(A) polymerase